MKKKTTQKIQPDRFEILSAMMHESWGVIPLKTLRSPKTASDFEQKSALAQCYAMKGFRDYMDSAIYASLNAIATNTKDIEAVMLHKGRMLGIKEFYQITRRLFLEYEKVNKKK